MRFIEDSPALLKLAYRKASGAYFSVPMFRLLLRLDTNLLCSSYECQQMRHKPLNKTSCLMPLYHHTTGWRNKSFYLETRKKYCTICVDTKEIFSYCCTSSSALELYIHFIITIFYTYNTHTLITNFLSRSQLLVECPPETQVIFLFQSDKPK